MTANRNVLWSRGGPRLLTVATALAVVLANVAMAADQAGAVGPPTMSAQRGGPQEGVRVRGHWVLDVRNPDGTLADRRDFHNAYLAEFGSLPTRSSRGRFRWARGSFFWRMARQPIRRRAAHPPLARCCKVRRVPASSISPTWPL